MNFDTEFCENFNSGFCLVGLRAQSRRLVRTQILIWCPHCGRHNALPVLDNESILLCNRHACCSLDIPSAPPYTPGPLQSGGGPYDQVRPVGRDHK